MPVLPHTGTSPWVSVCAIILASRRFLIPYKPGKCLSVAFVGPGAERFTEQNKKECQTRPVAAGDINDDDKDDDNDNALRNLKTSNLPKHQLPHPHKDHQPNPTQLNYHHVWKR